MALTDENGGNGMVMPVAPLSNYGNGGFGDCFGGNGFWIILLFLLIGGGWNNGGWGGGFGGGINNDLYPWMNQNNQMNDGFRGQMLNSSINGIQNSIISGFGDVQNALCGGFAGVNATVNGAQNAVAQQMYSNQIADLERSFNAQTAQTAGMSALQAQMANCCCDQKAGIESLRYTIATENCADRTAISDGVRDIVAAQTAGTQRILDKLCDQELMAERRENDNLRAQLNMQNLAASQAAQTAQLVADNAAQTQYVVNRVAPYPTPSYIVANPYGNNGNCGCNFNGCGC